jgi:hypothetical protein
VNWLTVIGPLSIPPKNTTHPNFEEIVIDKFTITTTPRRNRRQGTIHLALCINRATNSYVDGFRKEARSDRQEASVKYSSTVAYRI